MPTSRLLKPLMFLLFLIGSCISDSMAQDTPTQSKLLPSWAPDWSCMEEFERTTQHSVRCKEQLSIATKRMQEESIKCSDAMQKVYGLCGIGQNANEACYKKYRPDLNAACSGM
jgi:hypothetical protein